MRVYDYESFQLEFVRVKTSVGYQPSDTRDVMYDMSAAIFQLSTIDSLGYLFTSPSRRVRSIVTSTSVCLSVRIIRPSTSADSEGPRYSHNYKIDLQAHSRSLVYICHSIGHNIMISY